MRVECPHCLSKALITSSNALSPAVKDLYCQCTNTIECGASFVARLGHLHDLNPPQQTTKQMAAAILNSLPLDERQALIGQTDLFN